MCWPGADPVCTSFRRVGYNVGVELKKSDWFSRDVNFPKTGFIFYYGVTDDQGKMLSLDSKFSPDLIALKNRIFELKNIFKERNSAMDTSCLIVPLIFERKMKCKRSFWDSLESLAEGMEMVLELSDIQQRPAIMRCLVTCAVLVNGHARVFSPAGYFKEDASEKKIVDVIRRSRAEADPRASNCGIYQVIMPFFYDENGEHQYIN